MNQSSMLSKLVCFVCGSPGAGYSLHVKPREKGAYFPFLETHDPPKGCRQPTAEGIVDGCRVCYSFLNQQWDSFEATKTPAMKRLYWLKRTDNGTFTGAEMRLQGEYAAQMMGLQYHPTPSTGTMSPYDYAIPKSSSSKGNPSKLPSPSPSPSRPVATASSSRPADNGDGALDLSFGSAEKKPAKESRDVIKPKTEPMDSSSFMCFLCGNEQSISIARFIFAQKYTEDEPFYPFLTRVPIPPGVTMSASRGYQVCRSCKNTLHKQWEQYKSEATPEYMQVYSIKNMVVSGNAPQKDSLPRSPAGDEGCYLCGQNFQRGSMKQLNTRPPAESSKYSMYFPFILSLQCPKVAKPVDAEGRVYSCRACYSYLQRQWQTYQNDSIPMDRRNFLLRPLSEIGKETPPSSKEGEVAQPLNIRVSSAPGGSASITTVGTTPSYMASSLMPGLLAIAPHLSPQMMLSSMYGSSQLFYPGTNATKPESTSKSPVKSRADEMKRPASTGGSGKSSPGKARDLYTKPSMVKSRTSDSSDAEHCFICGSRCGGKICKLRAHPNQPDTIDNRNIPTEPFFPFITNQDPAPKARRLSDSGSANTCRFCFFHLLNQWREYERSAHPSDLNRWMRKYNYKIYVCYTCGILTPRSDVKTLNTKKFSTLPLMPKPSMGVQMGDDGSVVVCRGCRDDLQRQYDAFDKQGVPVPQRQFAIQNKGAHSIGYYIDEDGGAPSSKSGSVGDSAANATRQASFAAALRKLAKQAEGPESSSSSHPHDSHQQRRSSSSPPENLNAKRNSLPSTGALRGSPPTTLPNHYSASAAALASAHTDSSKACELRGASSAAGLLVDTIKQEQHHGKVTPLPAPAATPHVSSDRPESRPHSSNSSARVTPHLAMSSGLPPSSSTSAAAAGTYDTATTAAAAAAARGFQPYRGVTTGASYPPTSSAFPPGLDPMASYSAAAAAAAYQHALAAASSAAQHPFSQHGFRFDDPLLLERYRLLQHPLAAAAAYSHPSLMAPQSYLTPGAIRYPPELLAQQLAYLPPGTKLPDHLTSPTAAAAAAAERAKAEEELRREREKEAAEKEREERARREKEEREKREKEERERRERMERERREKERLEREKQIREAERRSPARAEDLTVGRHGNRSDFSAERLLSGGGSNHHYNNGGKDLLRHLDNEKRDKNILLHQFLQEQDFILRGSGLMGGYTMPHPPMSGGIPNPEPRDFSTKSTAAAAATAAGSRVMSSSAAATAAPSNTAAAVVSSSSVAPMSSSSGFHRPFERTDHDGERSSAGAAALTNGYDASKYAEFDHRRLMLERERMLGQEAGAKAAKNHTEPSPRLDKQYLDYHNRKIDERKPQSGEGVQQARLLEAHHGGSSAAAAAAAAAAAEKHYYQQYHHLHQQQQQQQQALLQQYSSNHTAASSYPDPNHPSSSSSTLPPKPSTDPQKDPASTGQVVSKLDIVERKVNEARQNGTFDSDDSDIEDLVEPQDTKLQRLLLISDGPPMAMNKSPQKLQYLGQFGLTTQETKKEVEFHQQCKRRRMYREPSVSPIELQTSTGADRGDERTTTPLQYPPTALHPDELNREPHYKQKAKFLAGMGLEPVPPERRRQLEHIRKVCEWDKQRRVGATQDPHNIASFIISQPPDPVTEQNALKRKHPDSSPPVNNLHKDPGAKPTTNGPKTTSVPRAVIFPESEKGRALAASASREFAEEFHKSVLQTTRQQQESKAAKQKVTARIEPYPQLPPPPAPHPSTHHSSSSVVPSSSSSSKLPPPLARSSSSIPPPPPLTSTAPPPPQPQVSPSPSLDQAAWRWPGMETVMEAYHQHEKEMRLERQILGDQCQVLVRRNLELNHTAERFSAHLAELMRTNQAQDEEKKRSQAAIEHLKRILHGLPR